MRPGRSARERGCDRPGGRVTRVGLIERYRDRLPFAASDPVVSLSEGSPPLVHAPRLSERVGADVWLKLEGLNPTGPVQRDAERRRDAAARAERPPRGLA